MKLLEPFSNGRLVLKNRVVISSYAAYHHLYAPGADIGWYLEHIRQRGEVGLFVLQCEFPRFVGIDPAPEPARLTPLLARLATAGHEHGTKVLLQLAHQGVQSTGLGQPDMKAIQSFSARPSEMAPDVAHQMDPFELEALIEGFGELAEVAVAAGLDGIELHAGHGHLLHQSFSRWANFRNDAWGEPGHFLTQVATRVRAALGDGLLGLRLASDDHRSPDEHGTPVAQLRQLAVALAATGLFDYLNPIEGSKYAHYGKSIGTFRQPHGDFLERTREITEALAGAVPVVGVGRVVTVAEAEDALQQGWCDLVAMTRAHLADPALLRKARDGHADRIRVCVGANQGCLDRAHAGSPLTCFQNPDVGREDRVAVRPAPTPKRVLVIGAGPAGLKAAELAARRGHQVTVLDARPRTGGRLAAITAASRARELVNAVDWVERELNFLGVNVRTGVLADAEVLAAECPDAVVLATGSRPAEPPFPTDGSVPYLSTDVALERLVGAPAAAVLVHDALGNEEAFVTYEQLASAGHRVAIVTPLPNVGAFLGHTHAVEVVDRVLALGCTVEERTRIVEVADGRVSTVERLSGRRAARTGVDAIVLAAPRVADTALVDAARAICPVAMVVGDAYSPRSAMQAFREGDNAGRQI